MGSFTKSAHEMAIDGDEPPPRYIINGSTFGSIDLSPPQLPIPTIDISLLSLPSSGEEVQQLRSVLSSWGCFQAIGHGIPDSYLDNVREVAKQFFSLPVEEKKKYSHGVKDGEGYGGDLIVSEKQVLDCSDRLVLKVLPEDERRPNLWPEFPTEFREVLHEYAMKIKYVLDTLFKAIAKSLNLEEDTF